MTFRTGRVESDRGHRDARKRPRTRSAFRIELLEGRELLTASLAALPNITSPAGLGYQVPLDGSGSGVTTQNFTATSSNPDVKVSIAQGKFVTFNVTHTSSGAGDPSFSGSMTFELFNDLTPITAERIENLVSTGFYTNTSFYRITSGFPGAPINGYIAQGGSNGSTTNLPTTGYPFVDEYSLQLVYDGSGQLAMANAGNDTNTSEIFITNSTPRFLDFNKTIFGQLVSGNNIYQDVINVAVPSGSTTPTSPVTITSASLSNVNPNGVVHVDTTGAKQGESSTVTVTASDPSTNTTATQSFTVDVGPTNAQAPSDPYSNERPFIAQDYPTTLSTGEGQTIKFQIPAVTAQPLTDVLNYIVADSVNSAGTAFNPVVNATATVDANGVVTVTPNAGYTGTINLLIGVANQVDHTGGNGATSPGNYDTHNVVLTVNSSSAPVGQKPIAGNLTTTATANTPTTIQLPGQTGNPGSGQGLTYTILTQPTSGTLTNLNPTTGTVTYTANSNFAGSDSFTYDVTSTGSPTPNLSSYPATVTVNVSLGQTNAVRVIDGVLVVTPPPRYDHKPNTIVVDEVNGTLETTVNGVLDSDQPTASTINQIVVYGGNTGNTITITPAVTVPATIDGGHGNKKVLNYLTAGGADARIHAWFGRNTVQGGTGTNDIVGREGHVRVIKSAGTDSVFLSPINPAKHKFYGKTPHKGTAPKPGAFYIFVGNKLEKTDQPVTTRLPQGSS